MPISEPEFTLPENDPNNDWFPDSLNTDQDGNPILTADSGLEDYIASLKGQAVSMGTKHPSEAKATYPNPSISKEDLDPSGDPNKPKDRTSLMKKLIPQVENEDFDNHIRGVDVPLEPKALMPDLNALHRKGDPRWSLGAALQEMYQYFLPRIQAYTEMLEAGGAAVDVNCNICTEEGVAIKSGSPLVAKVSKELRTQLNNADNLIVLSAPNTAEVYEYFTTRKDKAFKRHADAFVEYVQTKYLSQGYLGEAAFIDPPGFFFVKLTLEKVSYDEYGQEIDDSDLVCLRYYSDQKDYVVAALNINLIEAQSLAVQDETMKKSLKTLSALSMDIPDYTRMV
jgi:hypothetical protein